MILTPWDIQVVGGWTTHLKHMIVKLFWTNHFSGPYFKNGVNFSAMIVTNWIISPQFSGWEYKIFELPPRRKVKQAVDDVLQFNASSRFQVKMFSEARIFWKGHLFKKNIVIQLGIISLRMEVNIPKNVYTKLKSYIQSINLPPNKNTTILAPKKPSHQTIAIFSASEDSRHNFFSTSLVDLQIHRVDDHVQLLGCPPPTTHQD